MLCSLLTKSSFDILKQSCIQCYAVLGSLTILLGVKFCCTSSVMLLFVNVYTSSISVDEMKICKFICIKFVKGACVDCREIFTQKENIPLQAMNVNFSFLKSKFGHATILMIL